MKESRGQSVAVLDMSGVYGESRSSLLIESTDSMITTKEPMCSSMKRQTYVFPVI